MMRCLAVWTIRLFLALQVPNVGIMSLVNNVPLISVDKFGYRNALTQNSRRHM